MKTLLALRERNAWLSYGGAGLTIAGILSISIYNDTRWWSLLLLVLGTVLLLLFLAANLGEVRETGRRRSTRVRAGLVTVGLSMLCILGAVNYIVQRHPLRWDLTSNKVYSLSEQTRDVMKRLKNDVHVTLFLTQRKGTLPEVARAQALLEEYAKECRKIKFRTVNVDKSPSEARRFNIRELNVVVFESDKNRKDVLQRDYVTYAFEGRRPVPKFQGEAAFTSALMTMMDETQKVLYLTEGHGEKEIQSPQPEGLNSVKDMLEKSNYAIKSVNLLKDAKIPADCAVLASLGPQRGFSPKEGEVIREWMKKGGKFLLAIDPRVPADAFQPLLQDYGIRLGDNVVIDKTSFAFPDLLAVIPQYRFHPIVEKLSESKVFSVMPYTRSVTTLSPALDKAQTVILLETTAEGWGETNFTDKKPVYNPGGDLKGPVPMAAASEWSPVESPETVSRLVVVGGSSWLTNAMAQAPGNFDLAVNAVNWLAMQENKISIRPKEEEQRMMSLSNVGINVVKVLALILLPFGILAAGTFVYFRRRNL